MTKKGRQLFLKIGVTPSVAARGVTNLSDATAYRHRQFRSFPSCQKAT